VFGEPNGGEALKEDSMGNVGILVNSVVDLVEGFEVGDWGLGESLPMGSREGVEVLAASMGYIVVSGFAVLAFVFRW
jgi:hypothetical protein